MKRPTSNQASSRDSSPSPRRIAPDQLRDHGSSERIERIWGRLQHHIELTPQPQRTPARISRGWLMAAGVAAGFALGVGFAAIALEPSGGTQSVVMAPSTDGASSPQVFAAGTSARSYMLPGGVQLELAPDSIVDALHADGGGVALRLVRGEATLLNRSQPGQLASNQLALHVGDARVEAINGQLRVRLEGDRARMMMLDGSATVSSPHLDHGRLHVLASNDETSIPTRAVVASLPLPPDLPQRSDGRDLDPLASEPVAPASTLEVAVAAPAAWMTACRDGDYAEAAELVGRGPQAMAQVNNAAHLMCIATGHQVLKDGQTATVLYQRVVTEYADSPYAVAAAHYLAKIHRAAGNQAEQQRYEQLAQHLSKGALLSEQALCQKIEQEAAAHNDDVVVSLSERYGEQYPNGPCSKTVERLLAEVAKRKEAHAASDAGSKDAGANGAGSNGAGSNETGSNRDGSNGDGSTDGHGAPQRDDSNPYGDDGTARDGGHGKDQPAPR